jgi:hypothetical protein
MGVEFVLVNYKTKEMIDLGKGCWWEFRESPEYFLYREGIEEIFCDWGYFDNSDEDKIYWTSVIDLIWNFVKDADPADLTVVNDCGDDTYILRCYGFRFVGTRYTWENCMEFLNRHLLPEHSRRYDKNDCLKYIAGTQLDQTRL